MSKTADILRRAKALIGSEAAWIKTEYARNPEGVDASDWDGPPAEFNPNCFCVLGAISTATVGHPLPDELEDETEEWEQFYAARGHFEAAVHTIAIPNWNDAPERTHAEVMAAFDAAIALAEGAAS